jgi:hypothetical protein
MCTLVHVERMATINQIYNNMSPVSVEAALTIISGVPPLVSRHSPVLDLVSGLPRTWCPLASYLTWRQSGPPLAFSSLLCLIAGVFVVRSGFSVANSQTVAQEDDEFLEHDDNRTSPVQKHARPDLHEP